MGYKIEGDGTWQNTKIWEDDVLIQCNSCIILVADDVCLVSVDDGHFKPLSRVVLLGVYKLIGDGKFENTKLFINDELIRGIQSVVLHIKKDKDPLLEIRTIFLPNLVEE